MRHKTKRQVTYGLLDELKECLMSLRHTISDTSAMTLIADYLLVKGSEEVLALYNNYYCNGDYEKVVEELLN